jgi:hypothetical protein
VSAHLDNGTATVTFTPGTGSTAGQVLYMIGAIDSTDPNGTRAGVAAQSPATVTGLVAGDIYNFVVTATVPAAMASAAAENAVNGAHLRVTSVSAIGWYFPGYGLPLYQLGLGDGAQRWSVKLPPTST